MDEQYKKNIERLVRSYKKQIDLLKKSNPFGVPISTGGWAGSGQVIRFAQTNYLLHKAFPDIIDKEDVKTGLFFGVKMNMSLVLGRVICIWCMR